MKKIIAAIVSVIVVCSCSACSSQLINPGAEAFKAGKEALSFGNYAEALEQFELAQNKGFINAELLNLTNSVKSYIEAQDSYNDGDYDNAKDVIRSINTYGNSQIFNDDVDDLRDNIHDGLDSREEIDKLISETETLFVCGDYENVELNILKLESRSHISKTQKAKVETIKQQLVSARKKVSVESHTDYYDIGQSDKEKAKSAVINYVYSYEAFVQSGSRSAEDYYVFMSEYSPTWSNAYKTQWDYFCHHNITSFYVNSIYCESVTYDGNAYYVVDTESISETKKGVLTETTTRWMYTVINDGGTYKVTKYTKA